jgi:PleD family two-component response regulator
MPGDPGTSITISGGVAVLQLDARMTTEALIVAADTALFKAKRLGRDRIVEAGAGKDKDVVLERQERLATYP